MRVEIDIRRPRWLPARVGRRWKVLGAVAVLAIVAAPVGVLASDRFPDVPFGSGHEEVAKIDDAGIVRGCGNAGNYCPDNPVTRKQMAQFLARAGGSAERSAATRLTGNQGEEPGSMADRGATVGGRDGRGRARQRHLEPRARAPG